MRFLSGVLGIILVLLGLGAAHGQLISSEAHPTHSDLVISPAAGEPTNGFPNWAERVIYEWMNRARSDPQADLAGCAVCLDKPCYSPLPPLGWKHNLSRAARFHSAHMSKGTPPYFAHESNCVLVSNIGPLYPDSCDGSASCACAGPGITTFDQRIRLFGEAPSGEIIAASFNGDPNAAFFQWLHEPGPSPLCQFTTSNGHRWLILSSSGGVGVGMFRDAVGDFGFASTPTRIVSATHYPRQAASVEVWANWYDSSLPMSASVNVDGNVIPMTLRRGSGTNGAWSATLTGVGMGEHRYFVIFRDAAGTTFTYPSTGSYTICSSTSCQDWSPIRPGTPLLRGDVNGDGLVTISDVFYLANFLFLGGAAPIGSGDANADSNITTADIIYLLNHLFAGGPPPAA